MEEALKHPKPKQRWLPPQILRCKYFNSVPCMTLADLEFVAGFDHATALWSLKRYYIPYIMLTKETLRQYRYEIIYIPATAAWLSWPRHPWCPCLKDRTVYGGNYWKGKTVFLFSGRAYQRKAESSSWTGYSSAVYFKKHIAVYDE